MPNYAGQIVDTTHSGGRLVGEYWVHLFDLNESAFEAEKWDEVLTDEEIIEEMHRAFPGRPRPAMERVTKARLQYPPQGIGIHYHKFIVVDGRICCCTPRGRILSVGGRRKRDAEKQSQKARPDL